MLAFADESMRDDDASTRYYFMAATLISEDRCEEVRDALRPLARRSTGRVHWRDEQPDDKELIVKTVVAAGVRSVVSIGVMIDPNKQERARKLVLKRLLYELDECRVSHATLESRHRERDQHDMKSIGQFRNAGYLSSNLRVGHGKPVQEPLLWLPDIIAGVVGDDLRGENRLIEHFGNMIELRKLGRV